MSNNLWNLKVLDSPPLVTFDYNLKDYDNLFSKTDYCLLFEQHLNKLINLIDTKKILLTNEKTILEKLIYKNWNPLRKEKSMQLMRQLKKQLNKFEQINLSDLVKSVRDLSNSRQQTIKSLPSREVYEYLLIRLYSAFKLLDYTLEMIKNKLFIHLMKLIHNAIYLANNMLFVSAISRIYFILKKYKQNITFVYNCLREHIHLFKSTSIQWSNQFKIDQLPLNISISNETKRTNEPTTSSNDSNIELTFRQLINTEDFGVPIEREPEIVLNNSENELFVKWKKILIKNIELIESDDLVIFNKNLRKFLVKKLKKFEQNYSLFLKDILNKKLLNKNDFKIKKAKNKIFLKMIYKTISKILNKK